MSLVSQLEKLNSPLWQFLDTNLPGLRMTQTCNPIRLQYHAHKPDGSILPPPAPDAEPIDYSMLGTAIGHRLGWALSDADSKEAIMNGAYVATRTLLPYAGRDQTRRQQLRGAISATATELSATVHTAIREFGTADRTKPILLDAEKEHRLASLAVMTAWFTSAYHSSGRTVTRAAGIGKLGPRCSVERLMKEVPQYALDDIQAQMQLCEGTADNTQLTFSAFRNATTADASHLDIDLSPPDSRLHANPDVIASRRLLEIKSTTKPEQLSRVEIGQIAGYLLLDTEDAYGLERLGLYRSRSGYLFEIETEAFLEASRATLPLPALRRLFYGFLIANYGLRSR